MNKELGSYIGFFILVILAINVPWLYLPIMILLCGSMGIMSVLWLALIFTLSRICYSINNNNPPNIKQLNLLSQVIEPSYSKIWQMIAGMVFTSIVLTVLFLIREYALFASFLTSSIIFYIVHFFMRYIKFCYSKKI